MLLAASGVIGLWAIGFYSFDLNRQIFQNYYQDQARIRGDDQADRRFVAALIADPQKIDLISDPKQIDAFKDRFQPGDLLGSAEDPKGASLLYATARQLHRDHKLGYGRDGVESSRPTRSRSTDGAAQTAEQRKLREAYLATCVDTVGASLGLDPSQTPRPRHQFQKTSIESSSDRRKLAWHLMLWAGISAIVFNIGGFLGVYSFSYVAHWLGRRPTFAICFIAAMVSTGLCVRVQSSATVTIGSLVLFRDVFWLVPIMGFCQLSLFGGYAVYFPELFPTRLRSTGTSFCYNVGRFVACTGPLVLGQLPPASCSKTRAEPLRGAGLTMCSIFLVGLLVLPFLPETKGQAAAGIEGEGLGARG